MEEYVDATQFLSIREKWTDEVRNGKLYFKQKLNCVDTFYVRFDEFDGKEFRF